jgi:hypothetical protein
VVLGVVDLFVERRSAAVMVIFMKVALWWMELRRLGLLAKRGGETHAR